MKRTRQDNLSSFFAIQTDAKNKEVKRTKGQSRFVSCPICEKSLPIHIIETHASSCVAKPPIQNTTASAETTNSIPSDDRSNARSNENAQESWRSILSHSSSLHEDKNEINASNTKDQYIPGLFIYEDFISEEEEEEIIRYLDSDKDIPWWEAKFNGKHVGKRWGVHCSLRDRKVYKAENPLPLCVQRVIDRVKMLKPMKNCIPNEANAIDYRRNNGDYLKSHVDDRQLSKEPIANLSLAGDCIMTFRLEREKMKAILPENVNVTLRRRTLQILTQRARYDYSHGIANEDLLSDRRISITMRESPIT
jgi:alkylated DNA repair protein alkB family protein 4